MAISLWQNVSACYERILRMESDPPNCLSGNCRRFIGIVWFLGLPILFPHLSMGDKLCWVWKWFPTASKVHRWTWPWIEDPDLRLFLSEDHVGWIHCFGKELWSLLPLLFSCRGWWWSPWIVLGQLQHWLSHNLCSLVGLWQSLWRWNTKGRW